MTGAGEVYVPNSDDDHVARFSSARSVPGRVRRGRVGPRRRSSIRSRSTSARPATSSSRSRPTRARSSASPPVPTFLESFDTGPAFADDPSDAAFGIDGSAYVSQRGRDRVVRYALDAAPGPPPVVVAGTDAGARAPAPAPAKPALAPLPKAAAVIVLPSARQCVSRRNFRIRLRQPKGFKLKSATREPERQARRHAIGQARDRAGRPARAAQGPVHGQDLRDADRRAQGQQHPQVPDVRAQAPLSAIRR